MHPYDLLCGIRYTALPFAAIFSITHAVPMLLLICYDNKSIKGAFCPGETVLVVEDLVTSAASMLEAIAPLRAKGLMVTLHSLMTLTEMLAALLNHGKVSEEKVEEVRWFLDPNRKVAVPLVQLKPKAARKGFAERVRLAANPMEWKLFELMEAKQSNYGSHLGFTGSIATIWEKICGAVRDEPVRDCLEATSALKKQKWAEAELDKRCEK